MSSASVLFDQANQAALEEEYNVAQDLYNQAITSDPTVSSYYCNRAANHLKLLNYQGAVNDCQEALRLEPKNSLALYRSGMAWFHQKQYQLAFDRLYEAQKLGHKQCDLWIKRCVEALSNIKPSATISLPEFKSVAAAVDAAFAHPPPITLPPAVAVPLSTKVHDSWFQVKSSVTVTIFAKNLTRDDCKIQLTDETTLIVTLRMPDASVYTKTFRLFQPVKEMKIEHTAFKVEIAMEKVTPLDWTALESVHGPVVSNVVVRDNIVAGDSKPAYPSSCKKRLDIAEAERLADELEKNEKPEGEQALQKMFSSMFASSSPETQMAMKKSMQESGGTVLSMNWDEVSKTNYYATRKAPDGQEFRTWDNPN